MKYHFPLPLIFITAVAFFNHPLILAQKDPTNTGVPGTSGSVRRVAPRQASIEGVIIDSASRRPVSNVRVEAVGPAGAMTSESDAHGKYRIGGLAPGKYNLVTRADGYGKTMLGTTSLPRSVRLGEGDQLTGVDFELQPEAAFSGRVIDSKGKPVPAARIAVWARGFRNGTATYVVVAVVRSNDTGEFHIAGLGSGSYYVGVTPRLLPVTPGKLERSEKPEQKEVAGFYPRGISLESAVPLSVPAGQTLDGITLELPRTETYCVASSVEGAIGGEVASIAVMQSYKGWSNLIASGRIATGSSFVVCGLPAGDYYLDAYSNDADGGISSLANRGFSIARQDVELPALHPAAGIHVAGIVKLDDVKPDGVKEDLPRLDGLRLTLVPKGRIPWRNEAPPASVKEGGAFTISNVFPYEYWLEVQRLPAGYYLKAATIDNKDAIREPVRPEGGEVRVVLASDGASASGNVAGDHDAPVPQATIVLAPFPLPASASPSLIQVQQADQNGSFAFSTVAPGEYRLRAFSELRFGEEKSPEFLRNYISKAVDVTLQPHDRKTLKISPTAAH